MVLAGEKIFSRFGAALLWTYIVVYDENCITTCLIGFCYCGYVSPLPNAFLLDSSVVGSIRKGLVLLIGIDRMDTRYVVA